MIMKEYAFIFVENAGRSMTSNGSCKKNNIITRKDKEIWEALKD